MVWTPYWATGGLTLETSHAQQIALARVVLADLHTVVLHEATSMLDPTTARSVERTLAVILDGRTVLAIAHRMHTSHDADRVAVMAAAASSRSVRTTSCSRATVPTRGSTGVRRKPAIGA